MGRRDPITSIESGIDLWILTYKWRIWWQTHRNLELDDWLKVVWLTTEPCRPWAVDHKAAVTGQDKKGIPLLLQGSGPRCLHWMGFQEPQQFLPRLHFLVSLLRLSVWNTEISAILFVQMWLAQHSAVFLPKERTPFLTWKNTQIFHCDIPLVRLTMISNITKATLTSYRRFSTIQVTSLVCVAQSLVEHCMP